MDQIEYIVKAVLERLNAAQPAAVPAPAKEKPQEGIPAEMSARHVHLSVEDLNELFGIGQLEISRMISQPGQYLSTVRVRLIGPKGAIDNIAVLGPVRKQTQVEISATDSRVLGINPPVRLSGEMQDAAAVYIQAGGKMICRKAAIIAKRHLHMTPSDAEQYHVQNGQCVSVRVLGTRPLILEDVPVRVTEQSALALHIDTDEANAAGAPKDCRCVIIGAPASACSVPCSAQSVPRAPECVPEKKPECREVEGKLVTEKEIKELHAQGYKCLKTRKGQLITPLAKDTAKALNITITEA